MRAPARVGGGAAKCVKSVKKKTLKLVFPGAFWTDEKWTLPTFFGLLPGFIEFVFKNVFFFLGKRYTFPMKG